ncbi:MAG: CotH kinase family protein [Bacilli bacterium]|nr:CotH kinase family protein [Bacilli bacterium]
MKYFLLVGVCSISILSSCNFKPKTYEVSVVSNTLVLDNTTATENKDYETTISLVDPTKDYRLPDLIAVTISDKALTDTDYTYDSSSGQLKINANVINNKITITGEATPLEVYKVNMSSSTLTIDKTSATENRAYKGVISLVEPNEDYRLPTLITITVSDKTLADEDYTYNSNTGLLEINANVITNDIKIIGERAELDSYKADFICDGHIKVFIYKTRDYDIEPRRTNLAYARDKNSGDLLKDGTGEINFKVEIDENYDIDMLWVRGLYDKCQDNEKTKVDDVYRITKIRSDLQVTVTTKKLYCKKFAASDDLTNNSFTFNWTTRESENVDYVLIDVNHEQQMQCHDNSYVYNATANKFYNFSFTPILKNGVVGSTIICSRALINEPKNVAFPRVEINTEENIIPTYNSILPPPGAWGASIVNNNYVQSAIKIYDKNNLTVYDSTSGSLPKEMFDGAKIKYRGNTSALVSEKKSIKLKIKEPSDLLESFRLNPTPDVDYKNSEWLLINTGESIKQLAGFSIAQTLEFDWPPEFQYCSLYINNDFQGLYVLCESVSRGEGEGDRQSRYKVNKDGYIIENDPYWWKEDLSFETNLFKYGPFKYTFKYPDLDDINQTSYDIIYNYVSKFEDLLLEGNSQCLNYIDMNSYAKWILAHDILITADHAGSNMYAFKKDSSNDTKLQAGTVWDFDSAFNANDISTLSYYRSDLHYYYPWLLKFEEMNNEIKRQYMDYKSNIISDITTRVNLLDKLNYNSLLNSESLRHNYEILSIEDQIQNLMFFLENHLIYLDNNL